MSAHTHQEQQQKQQYGVHLRLEHLLAVLVWQTPLLLLALLLELGLHLQQPVVLLQLVVLGLQLLELVLQQLLEGQGAVQWELQEVHHQRCQQRVTTAQHRVQLSHHLLLLISSWNS